MKILGKLSPSAAPLAVAITFALSVGNLRAFGPGGAAGSAGGVSGGTTAGTVGGGAAAPGGSHGGTGATGGGHASLSAPAVSGARPGVSFSNNASRGFGGVATQRSLARPGGLSGSPQGTRSVYPTAGTPQSVGQLPTRSANAWSGTAVNTANNNAAARSSTNRPDSSNAYTNNRFAGRVSPNGYNHNTGGNVYRNGRYHYPYRYYDYPYAYGSSYAPYLGYYGGYNGAYPYYADGTYSDISNAAIGYDNGAATVTPQYTDQGQNANANDQPAPAPQVGPQRQSEGNAAQGTVPNNGPDSLVEAVQQELIRRGYFGGKVDAMYGPDTKEALRKFQQDRHLADTGLINEATLHALQLD